MFYLKTLNVVLELVLCWIVWEQRRFPFGFRRWRVSRGWILAAMGLMVIRRVGHFWQLQPLEDALLATGVSVGLLVGQYHFKVIFGRELLPLPTLPLAGVTINPLSQILAWDSGAEKLFGWTADEVLGKTLLQTIILPQDWEAHRAGMARYLAFPPAERHLRTPYVMTARRKDNVEIPVEVELKAEGADDTLQFTGQIRALVHL